MGWGDYFVDLIAEQLRQSLLCVCVCIDSPISPSQTLAAVFHLSLSAPELRREEEKGKALDVRAWDGASFRVGAVL